MTQLEQANKAFLAAAAKVGPRMIYDGVVTSVNADDYTCDINMEDLGPENGVRLRAVVSNNQSIDVLPVVNTAVVVLKIIDGDYILIAADQISTYRITVGTTVLKLDGAGALISKGTDTLGSIMTDLISQIQLIYAPKDAAAFEAISTRLQALLK